MVVKGKIMDLIKATDKVTQVIIRVKKDTIYLPVCFVAYEDKKTLINQLGIEKGDVVKITYFLKSKKWEEKYYTSAVIEKIIITEKKTAQYEVDLETGEIFGYK